MGVYGTLSINSPIYLQRIPRSLMRNIENIVVPLLLLILSVSCNLQEKLKFFEYCTYHNYPVESHIIHTKDGYNLEFFRIQKKNTSIVRLETVLYLQHGLTDSSDTWIVNQEHLAPGFLLANRGFDVWIGNTRGNKYSSHGISPQVRNFWDFSFQEMAQFDLPAAIDYIFGKTEKKIHYIGHSQGTMIMFAALSYKGNPIQEKLATFCAFGPVAYLKNVQSKLMKISAKQGVPKELMSIGINEVLLMPWSLSYLMLNGCKYDRASCRIMLTMISEKNNTVNNIDRMPVILGHFPAGTSTKNFRHFGQLIESGKFCKYDYGKKKNLEKYGKETPTDYNLSNIDFAVHLFVGTYDKLADVKDATRLYNQLVNSPKKSMKFLEFGHATFIWGKSTDHVEDAISVIEAYEVSGGK